MTASVSTHYSELSMSDPVTMVKRLTANGLVLALPGAIAACAGRTATAGELERYRRGRGALVAAETTRGVPRGRYVANRVTLESDTRLRATGWLLHPAADSGCLPAVLLQDGREENSGVVGRLPAEFGDVVVLALDYPQEIPYEIGLGDAVVHRRRLQRGARAIPETFSLGADYLAHRADVDSARLAIAATSFAVPFAVIAAAFDHRFRNVALVYGAGDLASVLAANLTLRPRWLRGPAARLAMTGFGAFAPERFVGYIAPRPIVMVNGIDDPQMPVEAVRHLYDAARPPKSIVWLRTGHLMPTDSALIRALVDTAFDRLTILRRARTGDRAGCG